MCFICIYNLAFSNNTVSYLITDNQGSERKISFPKATYNKQQTWNSNTETRVSRKQNHWTLSYIVHFKRNKFRVDQGIKNYPNGKSSKNAQKQASWKRTLWVTADTHLPQQVLSLTPHTSFLFFKAEIYSYTYMLLPITPWMLLFQRQLYLKCISVSTHVLQML